jgi:hypothetical protein
VLTDDVLVTSEEGQEVVAFPGPPRLKLFPNVAVGLAHDPSAVFRMNSGTGKLLIPLAGGLACPRPVPIAAFYEIAPAPGGPASREVRVEATTGRDAALAIVRAAFNQRYVNRDRLMRQFGAAIDLAERVPVRRLFYPRVVAGLPRVVEAVLAGTVRERATA